MVTRLVGKADQFDLEFQRNGDSWEACVPVDVEDGEYVVELTAYDAAGNAAYYTTVLIIAGAGEIKLKSFRDRLYKVSLMQQHYFAKLIPSGYSIELEG